MFPEEYTKIIIVDHHELVRTVLYDFLKSRLNLEVLQARNGLECLHLMEQASISLVITDIYMPVMNGIELTSLIFRKYRQTKVIVLSMLDDAFSIVKMIGTGASAYVLKEGNLNELIRAVGQIRNGRNYISPIISEKILDGFRQKKISRFFEGFSDLKLKALKMIIMDKTDLEIAHDLDIGENSAETARKQVFDQLGVSSIEALVQKATQEKWFEVNF